MERAFLAPEVESVEIEGSKQRAEISIRTGESSLRELVRKISRLFSQNGAPDDGPTPTGLSPDTSDLEKEPGASLSIWLDALDLGDQA